jgi:hypothetical protein
MKEAREFWISGFCPYCDKAISIFTDNPGITRVYQCLECHRGLTIIAQPLSRVIIEGGTPKQCFGELMPMPNETRMGNA